MISKFIFIGIIVLVLVVLAILLLSSNSFTPPATITTSSTQTTTSSVSAENAAYNTIDSELGSAVQGISNSDVQTALAS